VFPFQFLLTHLAAVLHLVLAPTPDSILAISRDQSKGHWAAALSSIETGLSILALQRRS
jgi:hypothetical protein